MSDGNHPHIVASFEEEDQIGETVHHTIALEAQQAQEYADRVDMTSFPMGFWNGMRIEKLDGDAVSDWADAGGRDGIMLVNNSQTQNTFAGITIRRPGTKVSRIAWEGREEATPCCGVMIDPTDGGVTVSQWLAPGQMELFMLD